MKRMYLLTLPLGLLGLFHFKVRKSELLFTTVKIISSTIGTLSRVVTFNLEEFVQPPPVHALRIIEYSVPAFKSLSTFSKINHFYFYFYSKTN